MTETRQDIVQYAARFDPARGTVDFVEPQGSIARGQACVAYDGERVLGGGWIEAALG